MNSVLFSFKRTFHKSVEFGKVLLTPFHLTPARFDMLHVIFLNKGAIRQKRLCEILGVTDATVSVMLQSLQDLGLVSRERVTAGDRRQNDVWLTDKGRKRISAAMLLMFESRFAEIETEQIVLINRSTDPEKARAAWQKLDAESIQIRRNFGDHSSLRYEWTRLHRKTALAYLAA